MPLKVAVSSSRPLTYGIVQAGEHFVDGVPYIRPVDMDGHNGVRLEGLRRTDPSIAQAYRRSSLHAGDIVVSIGPSFGKTMEITRDLVGANLTQGTARVAPAPGIDGRYLRWVLQSHDVLSYWDATSGGSTFRALNLGPLGRTPIPSHPLVVQRAIADHLDRETAQIDAFIAKNEELITLLTERRGSVIRQATTVGFGERGELIESKLDGVGLIPRDWRVMRLSWLFNQSASGTTPSSELVLDGEEADVSWVTTGELRERTITSTKKGISAGTVRATPALKVHPLGSLLVAMYGATIGRTGVLAVPAASNQAVCALSGPVGCDVEFIEYALIAARERLLLAAVGGGQPNINQEMIRAFRIPVPSLAEQRCIVQELRGRLSELDHAISVAGKGIELARERRAAVISAAVTGQIDVGVAT
ncbi:restriction endonuclease subunit S [Curtobacterium sp. 1310]|uniref:restriction endonuclease subunit S n=1 Tax=Curtobacterium sp. 1310 TaxID=2806570 RepID=UPI001AE29317|nr:restriction endonuclease subunit S [Curtobacterium sp. 1310]MBP1301440.1 type I restriction enzyme S subunit [Curtobacterium sp. 1310]